jgi:hypothetical protein
VTLCQDKEYRFPYCTAMVRNANTLRLVFCPNSQKYVVHFTRFWHYAQWFCDHWHIAAITERCAHELEAESEKNPPLENRFLHRWMRYCMDRSFETGDF